METNKFNLEDLLEDIKSGEVQLPDFQRSWIWSDKQIKSLLESVIRNFPINSIMLLECDADNTIFSSRPIEGVGEVTNKPRYLVLDGQQRLTSLFGALFSSEPVKCGDKKFFYYVVMKKALDAVENLETEDVIVSVNGDKKSKTLDLSTSEKEFAAGMFPLNKIFDSHGWLNSYKDFHANDFAKRFATDFDKKIIKRFLRYEIVYVELERNTSLEAVCRIFEKVNISGVKLNVFDLSMAALASHKENGKPVNLRADWEKISANFAQRNLKILSAAEGADFITALTLLVGYRNFCVSGTPVACKRENVLKLTCKDYLEYRDAVADGFFEAAKFLAGEAVTEEKYLPYKPQLIPLAAILAALKLSGKNNMTAQDKIRRWYWCGVFGEAYRDGHLARFAKDIVQVMNWIDNDDETPKVIQNTQISAPKLMKYKNVQSAAYKGMISIIFRNGATDFLSGKKMNVSANFDESIDDHHIFPKKYCADKNIPKERCDSIANKTPILSETNKIIGNKAPSVYIREFERRGIKSQLINTSLKSHFADPALCRANNFDAFIVDRANKIFDAIELLTGREISDRDKIFVEIV